jgi:hypothetical protein
MNSCSLQKDLQLPTRHPPPVLNARTEDAGAHEADLLLPSEAQHGARADDERAHPVGGPVHDTQVEERGGPVAHAEGEGPEDAAVLFVGDGRHLV